MKSTPLLKFIQFEYSVETETVWVESIALFNERRKKEHRSPSKMYNVISKETGLSSTTMIVTKEARKTTSLDKIKAWIEKKNNNNKKKAILVAEIFF